MAAGLKEGSYWEKIAPEYVKGPPEQGCKRLCTPTESAEDTAALNLLVEDKEAEQSKEYRPAGVLPEKLGEGVRPASQNPYPIYDQNLRYSLPYL